MVKDDVWIRFDAFEGREIGARAGAGRGAFFGNEPAGFECELAAFADGRGDRVLAGPGDACALVALGFFDVAMEGALGASGAEFGRDVIWAGCRRRLFLLQALVECVLRAFPDAAGNRLESGILDFCGEIAPAGHRWVDPFFSDA
jgi:hypothetical protein